MSKHEEPEQNTDDRDATLDTQVLGEETPLLRACTDQSGHKTIAHIDGDATYQHEIWGFIGYMLPIFGNQLLWRYFSVLGPVTHMGKNGSDALAGAALANTTIALLVTVPAHAASSALDTLSTQAHGGSRYTTIKDLNRLYSLRVYLVMWILISILLPTICLFEPVFRLLRVDAEVAHIAARYMQHAAFGVPALFTYECMRKYCQAQGRMVGPAAAVALAVIPTLPLLSSDRFGFYTPPIALGVFWNTIALFTLIYMYIFLPRTTFQDIPRFSTISKDLRIVLRLSLAGFIAIGSDVFAWEFLNFASAWMGKTILAANSVFLASDNFLFALPSALMNASATRVGNYLGSNQPANARTAAYTSLMLGNVVAATCAGLVAANARTWSKLFTSDPVVTHIVQSVMPFFCFTAFVDAIQGGCTGILRGAGRPIDISHAMAIHYVVGLPLAAVFAFAFNGGLLGLWQGFGVGLSIVTVRLVYVIIYNDWLESAREAQAHIRASDRRSIPEQDQVV